MADPKRLGEQVRTTVADPGDDYEDGYELSDHAVAKKWQGTAADKKDMANLGRVQQLRVGLQPSSSNGNNMLIIEM